MIYNTTWCGTLRVSETGSDYGQAFSPLINGFTLIGTCQGCLPTLAFSSEANHIKPINFAFKRWDYFSAQSTVGTSTLDKFKLPTIVF